MIVCPVCGGDTRVRETRATKCGLRRRRYCESISCTGRLTTYEIASSGREPGDTAVIMPAEDLELIRKMCTSILGDK